MSGRKRKFEPAYQRTAIKYYSDSDEEPSIERILDKKSHKGRVGIEKFNANTLIYTLLFAFICNNYKNNGNDQM